MNNTLQKEERLGFTVSEVMKHCWAADLHVLDDIKSICEAKGLKFFAAYGTLLGAVRHAGYIPWDDDIDIGMVRDDYIALTDLLIEDGKYNVLNPYTRSWYNMNFSHITNNNDLCFDREYLSKWGSPFLTGPDIYPYYYIPRDPAEEAFILAVLKKIDGAIALSKQADALREQKRNDTAAARVNEALALALVGLQNETGYTFNTERPIQNQLEILYDQVCRITEPEDADYLTRYDEYTKDKSKKFPKEYLENVVFLPFENTTIPAPAGFDAVLRARFGSGYLKPSIERGAHDYPFYKKQLGGIGNKLEEAAIRTCAYRNAEAEEFPFEDMNGKKKFVYYTSVRELMIHSDRAVDKIKEVLKFFAKNKDSFVLCWIPGVFPTNDEFAFDLLLPDLIKEYKELISRAADMGVYILADDGKFESLAGSADIFYGDAGLVSEAFEKKKKPVILQDYDSDAESELEEEGGKEGQTDG